MKILKIFVLPLFVAAFTNTQAFANSPDSKPSELRKQIIELVDDIDLSEMTKESEKVVVQFLLNEKSEIVIVNIGESEITDQIRSLLSRKDINAKGIAVNKIYTLPIVFNKG